MSNLFTWEDFKHFALAFNVPPETLAQYCNEVVTQRTIPVRLDKWAHDVVREDAGFTKEYLSNFPLKSRMLKVSHE